MENYKVKYGIRNFSDSRKKSGTKKVPDSRTPKPKWHNFMIASTPPTRASSSPKNALRLYNQGSLLVPQQKQVTSDILKSGKSRQEVTLLDLIHLEGKNSKVDIYGAWDSQL
jgi:hypothetical protein